MTTTWTPDEFAAILKTRMLEQHKIRGGHTISRRMVERAEFDTVELVANQLHVDLHTYVYAEQAATNVDELVLDGGPATWWQHIKQAFFPYGDDPVGRWLLRRWPVRRHQIRVPVTATRWAVYPDIEGYRALPDCGPVVFHDYVEFDRQGQ